MTLQLQSHQLKKVYRQIATGSSPLTFDGKGLFVKHMSLDEEVVLEEYYNLLLQNFAKDGLLSEAERMEELKKEGEWSDEEDKKIRKTEEFLAGLKKTRLKMIVPWQINQVAKEITETEEKISSMRGKKFSLIGYTREMAASNRREEYLMLITLFKDQSLKERAFDADDWEYFEQKDIARMSKAYSEVIDQFSIDNLKKICLSNSFFQTASIMGDDYWRIFNVQPLQFTIFQEQILAMFSRAKSIFKNVPDIPEECYTDYDKLVEFAERAASGKKVIKKDAKSVVGASREDLKKMGIDSVGAVTPFDLLRKSGKKSLTSRDFANG